MTNNNDDDKPIGLPDSGGPQIYKQLGKETLTPEIDPELRRFLERPKFTIRARLILAFLMVFVLTTVITVWIIYTLSVLQEKISYLEVADNYMSEIQQARRFEKNYLLYGTNLDDALSHLHNAQKLLRESRDIVNKTFVRQNFETMAKHTEEYETILQQLSRGNDPALKKETEAQLRNHGSLMVAFALDFSQRERAAVDQMFFLTRRIPFVFLGVLMLTILVITAFLSKQLLGTLSRFMDYTKRIGEGEFSHIVPFRKYQDEFSNLALAINHMIDELDRRHRILVESHKLRAIGNLVAGVSHELNNPLNNILLTAATLSEEYGELDDAERNEMIHEIINETERSQKIVRNLLDFARESPVHIEPLHVDRIVRQATSLVANQVKIAKVRLEVDIPPDPPLVHGDNQLLTQVFVNLLLNAVDALPEKGIIRVSIRMKRKEKFLAVMVADNGPGMPDHVQQRIFEPFFTTKSKGKGTGLGLSVSRGIMNKLGGYIEVESTVGEGTTFIVLFPLTDIPFEQPKK